MNAVPFSIDSVYGGFGRCHGILRDEGGHLVLEFQVRDAVLGLLQSGVREARVPIQDLAAVNYKGGWFGCGARVVIQGHKLGALAQVPGMNQGQVELQIARKDRAAAERLVAGLHTD